MRSDSAALRGMLLKYAKKNNMPLFPGMLEFAEERHAGEIRLSGEPYMAHIYDGCFIMVCFGIKSDVLFCGYTSHDLPENGKATLEEIERKSCHEVAMLADFLNKKGMIKAIYFLQLSLLVKAVFLKAIDRLSNMGDMFEFFTIEKQEAYLYENEKFIFPMIKRALEKFSKYRLKLFVIFKILEVLDKLVRKSVELYRELEEAKKQLKIKENEIKKLRRMLKK